MGTIACKTYSSTQATIALSSAEAEYYAMVKAGSVALGLKAMYGDFGVPAKTKYLYTDASGAKGIALRRGLGKLRHVDVHLLWLQHQVSSGVFKVYKVDGKSNPADLMTKYLTQEPSNGHMNRLRYSRTEGRAAVCPQVQQRGGLAASTPFAARAVGGCWQYVLVIQCQLHLFRLLF